MEELAPQQLKARLDAGEPLVVLDVREPWEYDTARIAGSLHIPMMTVPGRLDELDPAAPTAVVCHHGVRSLQVALFLEQAGFQTLYNLRGGIDAWSREVDPEVPLY